MPIYAYRCAACGHAKDVLQKLSDPLLTTCPACGADAFNKQLTAAGFQLKGSGWYVTDFRGGNTGSSTKTSSDAPADKTADKPADKPAGGGSDGGGSDGGGGTTTSSSATSSTACGGSCACH